jgi:hypothetical protein
MALIHVVFPDPVAPITKIVLLVLHFNWLGLPKEYRLTMLDASEKLEVFSNGNVHNFI